MKMLTKKCIVCGKKYTTKKRNQKYCSHKCRNVIFSKCNFGRLPWNKGKKGIMPIPWNKGKKLSEEHRQKLRGPRPYAKVWIKGKKGIHLSPNTEFKKGHIPWHIGTKGMGIKKQRKWTTEEKMKMAEIRCGDKSHFWKGGISKENYRLRRTFKYREWRKAVFEKDNYTCQRCFQKGGRLQVHHVKSWEQYPELRFEISNGITLCIFCHKQTDTFAKNLRFYGVNAST